MFGYFLYVTYYLKYFEHILRKYISFDFLYSYIFHWYIRIDHLRLQNYKNKQLKNSTLEFEEKTSKEENIYKKLGIIGTIG